MPELCALEGIGHELLFDKVVGEVVCILISFAIAQLIHEFRGGITQVQRHRQVACLLHQLQCLIDSQISRVGLLRGGEIHCRHCQWYAPFGPSYLLQCVETGVGYQHRVGVRQSYIFASGDD